ncbi:MAG: VanZ family protein [Alphaproteobacteria bacterium]
MRTFLFHCVAVCLVIAYVNTFVIWQAISNVTSKGFRDAIPFVVIVLLVLIIVVSAWMRSRQRGAVIGWKYIAAALVVALIGLASTDPAFPAKRIHVPQYLILTVLLSFSLPKGLRTNRTLFFVLVAAALYGVHDEFLQGLHDRRTFGVRDMFINFCGAGAGALAIRAFTSTVGRPALEGAEYRMSKSVGVAIVLIVIGVSLFASAATGFRYDLLPDWTVLPAIAGAVALALVLERLPSAGDRAALRPIVVICLLFAAYPAAITFAVLEFA